MDTLDLRVISGAEVRELLTYPDCVRVVAAAMREVSAGNALLPLRQFMALPAIEGRLAWMPGFLGEPSCFGIKLLSLYPGNPAVGLSSHVGLYVLYESAHGRPLAILEASALTAVRTAAASVVATQALARADARVLAIIGTGEEAHAHLEAFQAVRPFEHVIVWGRNADKARSLAARADALGVRKVSVAPTVREAAAQADVVCTVTSSPGPLLSGDDLRPGQHLCLVGSSIPQTREVDDEVVVRSRYYVDYRGSARAQAGELLHAIEAGRVTDAHIVGEIGEVLAGRVEGRRSDSEITLYKSLGIAAQDLAAALLVLERARERQAGTLARL